MKPIIKVENVSKQYQIGPPLSAHQTLREAFTDAAKAPLKRLRKLGRPSTESIWALRNISFEVQPGDVLGFVGSNGAGKSTLLKILSRITEPTSGRIELYGRIGSLLEVGTGFHPELTGRENIYFNGAVLGMKRDEISRKFDAIVAFSEVEKFIETPVKYYSSGMYMRLAFSVAAHLDPEILIVDEVLAVGDAAFQKKCLRKMEEVAEAGHTVLFVSHNMTAVQSLCSHVIWLDKGEIRDHGLVGEVGSQYLRAATATPMQTEENWDDLDTAPGNERVRLRRAYVSPIDGAPTEPIDVSTPIVMEFEYWNLIPGAHLNLSVVVSTEEGYPIFNTGSGRDPIWSHKPFPGGLFRSRVYIPGGLLNDGTHRVQLHVIEDESVNIFHADDILVFDVQDLSTRRGWYGKWIGAVRPDLKWETKFLKHRTGAVL
jgi:lipopolysaccharide transport system ATP-binding protein